VPEVVVGCRGGTWWTTRIGEGPADPSQPLRTPLRAPGAVRYADGSRSSAGWTSVVADAVERIAAGDVAKVVLARDLEARTEEPLDVRWPLARLAAHYPECWTFAVDGLLGATPEMLVRLVDGVATSRVLAGTLRRSGDANKDLRKGTALARSIKDVEEHGYGVRSVVDALALHCTAVEVPPAPFVLELPNVMHLASDVTGVVRDGATSLELVASLHPSAAVCGTPTRVALDLIREIEGLDRGRYAGPVGWLDASGDGEWGIALRCAAVDEQDPHRLRLFAGCGIVAGSRPEDELAESNAKLVPMRDALGA
jgi:menaquinone-specific isochorismate synthase